MNKPLIIGFTGLAKSGKDTAASMLQHSLEETSENHLKITRIAFADGIRDICRTLGFTDQQLNDQDYKEKEHPFWGVTPRWAMQHIGTEMFRNCWRNDFWVKLTEHKALQSQADIVIITDVRFPNEADWVKSMGGILIKIERQRQVRVSDSIIEATHPHITGTTISLAKIRDTVSKVFKKEHVSEQFISQIQADHTIRNDSTVQELNREMYGLARLIVSKHQ